ncbi:MAG: hypothetical protein Q4A78_04155 [Peptostreptococcaceae bacterium]|nr:hypothetical protein [Peptostreptococcaceae bacterium]
MKKGDLVWGGLLLALILFLVVPATHEIFVHFTADHPYLAAFIKFSVLATMGETLAIRMNQKDWIMPAGVFFRFLIWGLIGMLVTLMFQIFIGGIGFASENGYLPAGDSKVLKAFLISFIMNLTFAPTFMAFHKFTDTYIDMYYEGKRNLKVVDVVGRIDWKGFIGFVILKTIPFFWVPAHFVTFLLPGEYRMLFAAALSIALGVLLAMRKGVSRNA